MIKAIIVDDEEHSIENLENMIQLVSKDIEILATTIYPLDAIKLINTLRPDIIFLDIEMPNLNGFDLYQKLNVPKPRVIFVTAYHTYAIQAFKANAIDYVLKPIDLEQLNQTVERIKNNIVSNDTQIDFTKLILSMSNPIDKRFIIHAMNSIESINLKDLIYLSAQGSYTIFHLENREIISSRRIGEFEESLPKNHFVRIHKQYLININEVESYIKGRGGEVILKNGVKLEVSHRKRTEFLDAFLKKDLSY